MSGEDGGRTTIWVSDELWAELNQRKNRGDTFEDVIWRLLEDDQAEDGEVADGGPVPGFGKTCPDCGLEFKSADEMLEHVQNTEPGHSL